MFLPHTVFQAIFIKRYGAFRAFIGTLMEDEIKKHLLGLQLNILIN